MAERNENVTVNIGTNGSATDSASEEIDNSINSADEGLEGSSACLK
jgi:hypothetical protein